MTAPRRRLPLLVAVALPLLLLAAACQPTPPPIPAPNPNATHTRTVGTNPDDRTPHVLDGQVYAVLDLGTRVVVGGEFTRVKAFNRPTEYARRGIFSYVKATGAIEAFNPVLDRGGVRDMVVGPNSTLILGGSFQKVNGQTRVGLAKIDAVSGAVDAAFTARANGWVNTMALRGDRLFVGGTFTTISGNARSRLAAVNARTGAVDRGLNVAVDTTVRGGVVVNRLDATRNGSKLVITGNFRRVGGQPRDQVAIIDVGASSSAVSSWSTTGYRTGACSASYDYYVKDVDISPDDRYFAVVTTGTWGNGLAGLCDTVARWEMGRTGPNQRQTWADWTGGDSLSAVAITGAAVYAAGHQRWANNENAPRGDVKGPGAVDRAGIAAYDPATGAVLPWTTQRDRGLQVGTLTPTPAGLWIGSDSGGLGNEWHPRLGFIPL
ncbi:hypothetical protein HC251_07915 [Iamia sp. SCSIO 61187]|uniref:hypothetical protein n=1 Tax=Iamia sp. SCSIO 61187 TaxID=2722752 RepID=UPI001C637388|nr:hypothetical protein [Iamia sp. SCSIO 61187]QYG92373.1 hypothetical protein HC251_07915 [Iamia sp. SCSIO 61187]